MLKSQLIHAPILNALARAGHGSKVLITDGNYPASTTLGPNARHVALNLAPGVVNATQVLESLLTVIPVEAACVMQYLREGPYALTEDPPIWDAFRTLLAAYSPTLELEEVERFAFYEAAAEPDVCLTIQTADQRIYANLMLTIGVVMPEGANGMKSEK